MTNATISPDIPFAAKPNAVEGAAGLGTGEGVAGSEAVGDGEAVGGGEAVGDGESEGLGVASGVGEGIVGVVGAAVGPLELGWPDAAASGPDGPEDWAAGEAPRGIAANATKRPIATTCTTILARRLRRMVPA